jgi:hypothetical protein
MAINEDLQNLFYNEAAGASKAYFIAKAQEKFKLKKKDIEAWLKDQEVVQVNKKVGKGLNLKITAKPRTFQIDIMFYKIGQSQKAFLLLVDIMSRKAFCYVISGDPNDKKIEEAYMQFLDKVGHVEAIEGDNQFGSKTFTRINEDKNIRLDTSVSAENHFTSGNKLGIIDRLTRTLKESIEKYRNTVDDRGSLQSMIDKILDMYNDSPHRGLKGKTPNQAWGDVKEQEKRNMKETMYNDMVFNKLSLGTGDDVRVLERKGRFDKGNAKFSKDVFEIHDRVGYSYKVKDSDGDVKRRRYKPNELQPIGNVQNLINRDRIKRDEAADKKYKTTNKLIRNEEMSRREARKAVKAAESDALGPARSTRSQARQTRSQAKKAG